MIKSNLFLAAPFGGIFILKLPVNNKFLRFFNQKSKTHYWVRTEYFI